MFIFAGGQGSRSISAASEKVDGLENINLASPFSTFAVMSNIRLCNVMHSQLVIAIRLRSSISMICSASSAAAQESSPPKSPSALSRVRRATQTQLPFCRCMTRSRLMASRRNRGSRQREATRYNGGMRPRTSSKRKLLCSWLFSSRS